MGFFYGSTNTASRSQNSIAEINQIIENFQSSVVSKTACS